MPLRDRDILTNVARPLRGLAWLYSAAAINRFIVVFFLTSLSIFLLPRAPPYAVFFGHFFSIFSLSNMSSKRRSLRLQARQSPTTRSRASALRVASYSPRRSLTSTPSYLLPQNRPSASTSRRTPTSSTANPSPKFRSYSPSPSNHPVESHPTLLSSTRNTSRSPPPSLLGNDHQPPSLSPPNKPNSPSPSISRTLPDGIKNHSIMPSPTLDSALATKRPASAPSPINLTNPPNSSNDPQPDLSVEMENEIEAAVQAELQRLSEKSPSPNNPSEEPILNSTPAPDELSFADNSASLELKVDLLIAAQKHSIESFNLNTNRVIALESKIEAVTSSLHSLVDIHKTTPKYHQQFGK